MEADERCYALPQDADLGIALHAHARRGDRIATWKSDMGVQLPVPCPSDRRSRRSNRQPTWKGEAALAVEHALSGTSSGKRDDERTQRRGERIATWKSGVTFQEPSPRSNGVINAPSVTPSTTGHHMTPLPTSDQEPGILKDWTPVGLNPDKPEKNDSLLAEMIRSKEKRRNYFQQLVESLPFEMLIGGCIVANCITIGVEVQLCPAAHSPRYRADPNCTLNIHNCSEGCPSYTMAVFENAFTAIFVVEFFMRWLAYGRWYHLQSWGNIGDAFLVWVFGVLLVWVLVWFDVDASVMRNCTVLRSVRLIRLARIVKNNPDFKEMWLLMSGLVNSRRTLLWTVVVTLFVLYVFGVFAIIFIGDSEKWTKLIREREAGLYDPKMEFVYSQQFFNGLDETMLTLLQSMTGDSWASFVARPIMEVIPESWPFFYLFILISVFVLVNLITAVIVESAMTMASQDKEQRLRHYEKQRRETEMRLQSLCQELDLDESGVLTREEYMKAMQTKPELVSEFKLLEFTEEDAVGMFDALDDGGGKIEVDLFVEYLRKMQGTARNQDLIGTERLVIRGTKMVEKRLTMALEGLGVSVMETVTPVSGHAQDRSALHDEHPANAAATNGHAPTLVGEKAEELSGSLDNLADSVQNLRKDMRSMKEAVLEMAKLQQQDQAGPPQGSSPPAAPVMFPAPGVSAARQGQQSHRVSRC